MATHSKSTLALGPEDAGRPVSAERFARAAFVEPWIYERDAGRLVVIAPEGQDHVEGSSPWLQRLVLYWTEHPDVVALVVPQAWVRVDGGTDRIGDIGVYLVAESPQPPIPDRVPDLMFEIVSPGAESRKRDYETKRRDYERLGVSEYVIIDRPKRSVTVLTRERRGFRTDVLKSDDVYQSPLLPGLAIPLNEVL